MSHNICVDLCPNGEKPALSLMAAAAAAAEESDPSVLIVIDCNSMGRPLASKALLQAF